MARMILQKKKMGALIAPDTKINHKAALIKKKTSGINAKTET